MKLQGKWLENSTVTDAQLASNAVTAAKIADANVTAAKLDSTAKQSVLESKLTAKRSGVLGFTTTLASSDTVTTEVVAAASVDTAQTDFSAKGIYAGAVSGASDHKKVLIRATGTDNGIEDGLGDEIYGVLSESGGVFTLAYHKSSGDAFTFAAAVGVDFFFIEIFDMFSQPVDSSLVPVRGVIDATQASALNNHISSVEAHDADSIDYESIAHSKKNIQGGSTKVESAISDLDDAIGALASSPTNYTPSNAAIVADHLSAIDAKIGSIGGDTVEQLTLTSTDIANKYIDLAGVPKTKQTVLVVPEGGPVQFYTDDFTIITDGVDDKRLNWDGLGMDGVLEVGDKLRIVYEVAA